MAEAGVTRNKVKEVLARHTDLEQSQNKAQGALLSVLALTQVTELKILLDVGTHGHRLYHFVLALLIGSIALQIFVGVIVIYIGHLRYQDGPKKQSLCRRIANCFICKCKPRCCRKKPRKRCPSYVSVPIGVGAPEIKADTLEMTASQYFQDDDSDIGSGCCDWPGLQSRDNANPLERHKVETDQARVRLSNAVASILKYTNEVERIEEQLKKTPRNNEVEKLLADARADLHTAKRDKGQAEAELNLADSREKQAIALATEQEEKEEMATFRKIRSWQQVALYLLYFITLMNVFVTAIGISTKA